MFVKGIKSQYIESFYCAALCGSLKGGAKKIGTSLSTLRRHVEKFEDIMGKQLLIRYHSGLTLTEHGKQAFEIIKEMRHSFLGLERLQHEFNLQSSNCRKMQIPVIFENILVNKVLKTLRRNDISTQFTPMPRAYYQDFYKTVDCGLIFEIPEITNIQKDFTFERIFRSQYGMYADRDYFKCKEHPKSIDSLDDHWILYDSENHDLVNLGQKYSWSRLFMGDGVKKGRNLNLLADMHNSIISAEGIALVTDLYASSNPDLVQVLPEYTAPGYDLYFFVRKDIQQDPDVEMLRREIMRHLNSVKKQKTSKLELVG